MELNETELKEFDKKIKEAHKIKHLVYGCPSCLPIGARKVKK